MGGCKRMRRFPIELLQTIRSCWHPCSTADREVSKTLPLRSNRGPRDAFCGDLYLPWYHSFHWHGGVHKQRAMTLHVRSRGETTEQLRKNARGQKSARQSTTERGAPTKEQTTAQSPRTKPTAPTEVHAPTNLKRF